VLLGSVFYIIYMVWWKKERLVCPECGSSNIVFCDKFMQQISPSMRVKIIKTIEDNYKKRNQKKD
jgi:hypothetical protein